MTKVPPWYVERAIANGHPTDRVIQVLQFLAVGHGYVCQFCGLPCQCVNVYMEGGSVRMFIAWMEGYFILLFNVL